jgi:hypothetical protein
MEFPVFVNRYGRKCLIPELGLRWFQQFQSRNQWWPKGRPGRKSRSWQERRHEIEIERQYENSIEPAPYIVEGN